MNYTDGIFLFMIHTKKKESGGKARPPAFTLLGGGGRATVSDGNVTGYQYSLRYNGTGANYQVTTTLRTPIPVSSFVNPQTRAAAQKSINEQVTSVTPK